MENFIFAQGWLQLHVEKIHKDLAKAVQKILEIGIMKILIIKYDETEKSFLIKCPPP